MTEKPREGDWIQTSVGVKFYPLDPRIEEINIEDIAHALAHQCRFSGHSKLFYSVAQHSCVVSDIIEQKKGEEVARAALLHDASEAYLVDIPRPLKHLQAFSAYRSIEKQLERMIFRRFGIDPEVVNWLIIRDYDDMVLHTEGQWLMPDVKCWGSYMPEKLLPGLWQYSQTPKEAKTSFLKRFERLFGGTEKWNAK